MIFHKGDFAEQCVTFVLHTVCTRSVVLCYDTALHTCSSRSMTILCNLHGLVSAVCEPYQSLPSVHCQLRVICLPTLNLSIAQWHGRGF